MSILIVEDNQVSAKLVEGILQREGHETVVAQTGEMALERLDFISDIQLVIADIMMPEMDGLEFIAKMRERPKWRDLPVIMQTSDANEETVRKAASLGCRYYLIKPVSKQQLLERVRQALGPVSLILLDKWRIIAELGIDRGLYRVMAESLSVQLHEAIRNLVLEHRREGEVSEELHTCLVKVMESAQHFGAERVLNEFSKIQRSCENEGGRIKTPCRGLLQELQTLHSALNATLSREKSD